MIVMQESSCFDGVTSLLCGLGLHGIDQSAIHFFQEVMKSHMGYEDSGSTGVLIRSAFSGFLGIAVDTYQSPTDVSDENISKVVNEKVTPG